MRVFVASTYPDMKGYQDQVLNALLTTGCDPLGMEDFGAAKRGSLQDRLNEIEKADIVLCILGTMYGERPPGSHLSYTEREVEHALKLGRDIKAFVLDWDSQPMIPSLVAEGADRAALQALRRRLFEIGSPEVFTTRNSLASKIAEAIEDHGKFKGRPATITLHERALARYRETSYDVIADWYDHWYDGHWLDHEPFDTLVRVLADCPSLSSRSPGSIKILDVACGTGNAYSSFMRGGYDVYGCDGSQKMLDHALDNCRAAGISTAGLVSTPLNWMDMDGYRRHLPPGGFDVVVNTANSFCHIPPLPEYMDRALANFSELLVDGGLLIIDTKKYIKEGAIDGISVYKEQRLENDEWIVRTTRTDPPLNKNAREVPGLGSVRFHTNLLYDVDPAFSEKVLRALIVLSVFGEGFPPQTALIPYYPLPVSQLEHRIAKLGFDTIIYPAKSGIAENWKYDLVAGIKRGRAVTGPAEGPETGF